jgi:hypothetical protein
MKKIYLFCIFCLLFVAADAQVVSLNAKELQKLKNLVQTDGEVKAHWQDLLKDADAALKDTPNPPDTILTEGILQGDPRKIRTWKSIEDMQKVYALAFAYKITDNTKYLTKAVDFLMAWANKNQPQGNPINDTNLDKIIFAYDLVKMNLATKDKTAIRSWLIKVGQQQIMSFDKALNKGALTHMNNWNSHRIKEVAQVAWSIDDEVMKVWVRDHYIKQVAVNLNPDGSSFDFHERDALHYHVYDVDPLLVAATILHRDKKFADHPYLFTSVTGSSLKASVNWLVPFFTGEKSHAEWINSKSAFDKKRAANGEKAYIAGTLFNPIEARTSIALAHYFDEEMLTYYQAHINNKSKFPSWQFVLNKIKTKN